MPYIRAAPLECLHLKAICGPNNNVAASKGCSEIITIPDSIANAIFNLKESAYVGRESELNSAEPEALCCDGGAT